MILNLLSATSHDFHFQQNLFNFATVGTVNASYMITTQVQIALGGYLDINSCELSSYSIKPKSLCFVYSYHRLNPSTRPISPSSPPHHLSLPCNCRNSLQVFLAVWIDIDFRPTVQRCPFGLLLE